MREYEPNAMREREAFLLGSVMHSITEGGMQRGKRIVPVHI